MSIERLHPRIIAKRRVVSRISLGKKKGVIVLAGTLYKVSYDDLLDLCNACDLLMMKTTHKLLRKEFRPAITNRDALQIERLEAGGYELYDTSEGDAPCPAEQVCTVTEDVIKTHYLRVEIGGQVWHNWFCRLDELIKCLFNIIREAQAEHLPSLPASQRAPVKRVNLAPEVLH